MTDTMTEPQIVPDFGDDDEERKIAFVCSKGSLDMAYPALIMASGALEQGVETHIFFTFWGMDMINKKTMGNLKFSPVGNPATHMPAALAPLPGMTTMATHQMTAPGDRVLVGVSGGPDSMALLHLLGRLAPDLKIRLGVAHMNHCLRGASADRAQDPSPLPASPMRWEVAR